MKTRCSLSEPRWVTNYKTYLIKRNSHGFWVEKGGFSICWCKDEADGKRIIDELTAP